MRHEEFKYFYIIEVEQKPKTSVFHVRNTKSNALLGLVLWSPAWRQYIFRFLGNKEYDIDMSRGCMKEINSFIQKLMDERKNARK